MIGGPSPRLLDMQRQRIDQSHRVAAGGEVHGVGSGTASYVQDAASAGKEPLEQIPGPQPGPLSCWGRKQPVFLCVRLFIVSADQRI